MTGLFVIVRHGNTFAAGEAPRRIGARTDLPLVASGRDQARRLGARFAARGWRFDRVLCSPLLRTRETAAIIRDLLPSTPDPEPSMLLAEIDHGIDEDQPEAAVIARIGQDALIAWDRDGVPPPGWIVDRNHRIEGWRRLYAGQDARATLLVTSNGAARFALSADPTLSWQAATLLGLKLRTGAFGVIRAGGHGLHLVAWDRRP